MYTFRGFCCRPASGAPMRKQSISPADGFLPGCVSTFYTRCGKPNCRCAAGQLHGPYHARRWREGKRKRRVYVRLEDLAAVREGCAAWREVQAEIRQGREERRRFMARARDAGREVEQLVKTLRSSQGS